jgi:autotransporter-associated beta strand protein
VPGVPFSSSTYRSSIATSGSTFYASGASTGSPITGGIWYYNGSSFLQVTSTATGQPTNTRNVEIYGSGSNAGLFFTSAASSGTGVFAIGAGVPTSATQTATLQINTGTLGTSASPYGFVMFSTGAQGAGVLDLTYIADDRTTTGGGLEKWTFDGSTWTNSWSLFVSGTVGSPPSTLQSGTGVGFAGLRGLAGTYDAVNGASLYATTTELSNNRLISILDTGTTTPSTYTTLLSAGTNYVFRGVDLSPVAEPAPGPNALIWNTTTGTWNTTNTVWTTGTGGTLTFSNGDSVTFSGTGGGTVTLSGSLQPSSITVSATSGTYTFISSAGNLLTGTTGLAKSGGGTFILSGTSGFTGTTSITGGALLVNGVLSSATTTVAGGLLGGSGTVSGAVQMAAGGTIAPGAAPGGTGILTLGSLSGTGGAFAMDITGTGAGQYDRLVIGGNLDYSGNTLQISFMGTYADGTAWDLFDFTTKSGTLAGISPIVADSAYNGLTWSLASTSSSNYDQRYGAGIWLSSWGSNGQRFIFNQADGVLTVVPEPSTFVLAGVGLGGYAISRWRRRSRTRPA